MMPAATLKCSSSASSSRTYKSHSEALSKEEPLEDSSPMESLPYDFVCNFVALARIRQKPWHAAHMSPLNQTFLVDSLMLIVMTILCSRTRHDSNVSGLH